MIKFQPTAFINIIKVMAFKKHTAHGWGNTTEKREREREMAGEAELRGMKPRSHRGWGVKHQGAIAARRKSAVSFISQCLF